MVSKNRSFLAHEQEALIKARARVSGSISGVEKAENQLAAQASGFQIDKQGTKNSSHALAQARVSELEMLRRFQSSSDEVHVGLDIRSLRKSRGMTLIELCDALERSSGWLSQVERGQSIPSIQDLRAIAKIFEVPVSFFFRNDTAPEHERGLVVRAGSRAVMGSTEAGLTEELLSPDISGDFEMIRSVFEPGARRPLMEARPTQDGGYVISGNLELTIGGRVLELGPGDSFQFDSEPYGWRNKGSEPAVVIWIISPPIY